VWTQENRDTELHVLSIFLFYPEEDRSCLPNLISGVGRYTARSTRAVTSAKARSGGIVNIAVMAFPPLLMHGPLFCYTVGSQQIWYEWEGELNESYLLDKRVMVCRFIVGYCACITMSSQRKMIRVDARKP
jgi:hypothetical protein